MLRTIIRIKIKIRIRLRIGIGIRIRIRIMALILIIIVILQMIRSAVLRPWTQTRWSLPSSVSEDEYVPARTVSHSQYRKECASHGLLFRNRWCLRTVLRTPNSKTPVVAASRNCREKSASLLQTAPYYKNRTRIERWYFADCQKYWLSCLCMQVAPMALAP